MYVNQYMRRRIIYIKKNYLQDESEQKSSITLFRPSQLAQSRSIFCGGTVASIKSKTPTNESRLRKKPLVNENQSILADLDAVANLQ